MKRPDYAPLAAPPNPRADEAQAALVEYGRGMLQNAPRVEVEAAQPTDMAIATPVNTPHIDDGQAFSTEAVICSDADMASDGAILQLNDEAVDLLERVLEKHGELTDEAKISAALLRWPNMQPYAATARVETLTTTLPGGVLARGEVVTVTVIEKENDADNR